MKVIYINASLEGNAHEIIDSALIGMIASREQLEVFAQKNRIQCLEQIVDNKFSNTKIEWHPLRPFGNNKLKALRIALVEACLILRSNKRNVFLVSFMNGFSSNIHNLISILTGAKILLVAHNDAECVLTKGGISLGMQKTLHKFFFKYAPLGKNLRVLVLGDNVIDSAEKYSFTWLGKSEALKYSMVPSKSTLIELFFKLLSSSLLFCFIISKLLLILSSGKSI